MSPSDGATFRITPRENGTVVVHVDGTLRYENRQQLKLLVLDALGAGETKKISRHCREAQAGLLIAALNEDMRLLIQQVRLDVLLQLVDTVDRAVAA
jgi:anti-anti-sigma regulatory factor